jgi:Flp pilus assembly protein TadG
MTMRMNTNPPDVQGFLADRRGAVALTFGLVILVLGGISAFSIDYSRALAVRERLQSAVDAAVLAADPSTTASFAQVVENVNANFAYNMPPQFGATQVAVAAPVVIPDGYQVNASANVPTTFGRLLGIDVIPINVTASARRAQANVEIALVLDNTASMEGAKMAALKVAAKKLVTDVIAASDPDTVKFALVPFSNYVNVGKGYRTQNWMSVPADSVETKTVCWQTTDWDGCPKKTFSGTCYNDGKPYTCTWEGCISPGPERTACWTGPVNVVWNGCAGSRKPAPDKKVDAQFNQPIPGIMDSTCPSALTRLTANHGEIKNQIDAMIAQGETYIPSGLMWGWRTLSPNSPFADGVAAGSRPITKKVLILMTDGENTKSQSDTNHDGSSQSDADDATDKLCKEVKTDDIELYTIAFEVTAAQPKAVLQKCASPGQYYFDAQNGPELDAAFSKIAGALVKLALVK